MTRFVIGLGANLGAREASFHAALDLLADTPGVEVEALSSLYDTAPVGPPQPRYLNAAVRLRAALDPERLLDRLLAIERVLGRDRVREERWGPRTLDLDILWASTGPVRTPRLEVPHPRLLERPFALAPLLDVAPPELARSLAPRLAALGGPPARVPSAAPAVTRVDARGVLRIEAVARDAAEALALVVRADPGQARVGPPRTVELESSRGLEGLAASLDSLFARGHRVRWLAVPRIEGSTVHAVARIGPAGEAPRRVRALALEPTPEGARALLELASESP